MANEFLGFGIENGLEMYVTIFAWEQFNSLWEIATQTGLIFLPFIGIILDNITEPLKSQQVQQAASTSLRRVEFEVIVAFIVVLLAAQPIVNLQANELRRDLLCQSTKKGVFNDVVEKFNEEHEHFKATKFVTFTQTEVPIWWYAVMAVSSGITKAAKKTLPCADDLRLVRYQISEKVIADEQLVTEIKQFAAECFIPSYLYFINDKELMKKYITSAFPFGNDLWMGSEWFIVDFSPGIYRARKAQNPVTGFKPTAMDRYRGFKNAGTPSCMDWWGYPTIRPKAGSILARMADIVEPEIDLIVDPNDPNGPIKYSEARANAIKELLRINFDTNSEDVNKKDLNLPSQRVVNVIDYQNKKVAEANSDLNEGLAHLGLAASSVKFFPKMRAISQAVPIALALILMSIYIMMPLFIIMSRYSIESLIIGASVIFAFKFSYYLLHFAKWMDILLIQAVGGTTDFHFYGFNELVLLYVAASAYIFLPLIFLLVMGWSGSIASQAVNSQLASLQDSMAGERSGVAAGAEKGMEFAVGLGKKLAIMIAAFLLALVTGGMSLALMANEFIKLVGSILKEIINATVKFIALGAIPQSSFFRQVLAPAAIKFWNGVKNIWNKYMGNQPTQKLNQQTNAKQQQASTNQSNYTNPNRASKSNTSSTQQSQSTQSNNSNNNSSG